jgi:molybdate transport system regulatory protein
MTNAQAARRATKTAEERSRPRAELRLRVDFGAFGAIGPGKIRLLELIGEHGSITTAGRTMAMSYRRAWLLVESLNNAFREPLVAAQRGGSSGGGAALTPFGREIVRRYRAIEAQAAKAVAGDLKSLSQALADAPPDAVMVPPKRRG